MKKILFNLTVALAAFLASHASAGTLTIEGSSKVNFSLEGEQVKIEGSYSISNNGDEVAQNVFPLFELGGWKWAGEGRSIEPGKSQQWDLDESIATSRLGCITGRDCTKNAPTTKGYFAVRVLRMYEDSNGHPFSAPDVLRSYLGDVSGEDRAALRVPSLVQTIECKGNGQEFGCKVMLKNGGATKLEATVSLHSTRELEIEQAPMTVEIEPNSAAELRFNLKNFNGLAGSTYPVMSVVEWENAGLRNSLVDSSMIAVEEVSHSSLYLILGGVGFLLVGALLYIFVLRAK